MRNDIDVIFNPRSVAVIGASTDPEKWGNLMAKSLVESEYSGDLYLVNPRGEEVHGMKTYPSILDVEDPVDLAIIGIPASRVKDAVRDCVEKGVRGVIIVTAHFGEYSDEGKDAEKEISVIVGESSTRIIGPNCIGVCNSSINLNTAFSPLPPGVFAFLTQSGNIGLEISYFAEKRGLGFSKFASFGNQVDVLFHELLDYVKDDPDTHAIFLYIEGLKDGREFLRVAREATRKKPVVAIKVGVSSAGVRAATSHTGALAGSDEVYDAAFRQVGIIRVGGSVELLDVGEALIKCPLPRGNRVGILCNGGGAGALAADLSGKYGLSAPVFSEETSNEMEVVAPAGALHSTSNPVDFADEADPWAWVKLAEIILKDRDIDALVTAGGYGGYEDSFPQFKKTWAEMAYEIANLQRRYDKPVIMQSYFLEDKPESLRILREHGVPVYRDPETAVKCLSILVERSRYLEAVGGVEEQEALEFPEGRERRSREIIEVVESAGRRNLVEPEAREILLAYGLPVPDYGLARSSEEAVRIADRIGYPLAIKIVSPDIVHKSEAGGVKLDLMTREDVNRAYDEVMSNARAYDDQAEVIGAILSPMEVDGTEVIVGTIQDPTFGPTVMFGVGGVFCEVLEDVSFRVAPLERRDAHEMLREIRGFPMLSGVRGREPVDICAIVEVLMRVSVLAVENPEIAEMDLNPLFVSQKGARIADARMTLGQVPRS